MSEFAINLIPLREGVKVNEFARFSAQLDQPTCLAQDVVEGFSAYAVTRRDPGAPAQSFGTTPVASGGPQPYTTLGTCPTTQEEPYLYTDSSGNYNVFVPSVRTNSSGPSWASGNTPGTSLSVNNTFYVVNSSSTITTINAALAAGENLLFTPGVYSYASTINVTKADTKIIGLGFATIIPTAAVGISA